MGLDFGTIRTEEQFEDKRRELAEREWARLEANDSLECRNCHDFESMDFTQQSSRAAQAHSTTLAEGEATCITCHKGIAHELPDMSEFYQHTATGLPGIESWVAHLKRDVPVPGYPEN